ncbi:Arginase/deacetylase [Alternaria alternata]|nr:Arginase/deacetylase [Alternaria alternata]
MRFTPAIVASFAATVAAHGDHGHDQEPLAGPHEGLWYNTLPGDGGTQVCASNSRDDAPKQYDNGYALQQIEQGHNLLLSREPYTHADKPGPSKKGTTLPRLITLGGDHTITLPLLRSINREYGPITVIHFDSHL